MHAACHVNIQGSVSGGATRSGADSIRSAAAENTFTLIIMTKHGAQRKLMCKNVYKSRNVNVCTHGSKGIGYILFTLIIILLQVIKNIS